MREGALLHRSAMVSECHSGGEVHQSRMQNVPGLERLIVVARAGVSRSWMKPTSSITDPRSTS